MPDEKAPAPAPRPRGRPAKPLPEDRLAKAQAELAAAQEALRRVETRRAEIVGAAVLRRAGKDREFSYKLAALLREEVTARADFQLIVPLLAATSAVASLEIAAPELFPPDKKPVPPA